MEPNDPRTKAVTQLGNSDEERAKMEGARKARADKALEEARQSTVETMKREQRRMAFPVDLRVLPKIQAALTDLVMVSALEQITLPRFTSWQVAARLLLQDLAEEVVRLPAPVDPPSPPESPADKP